MPIISRTPGRTNQDMLEYCILLKSIVSKKKEIKVGRGKNIDTILIDKYNTHPSVIENIDESIKYYKETPEQKSKVQLRDYQTEIVNKGTGILTIHGFLYLAMEVRTGKTITSLSIADRVGVKNVLFITKKKAMSSISDDYSLLSPSFHLCIINYESLHTVMDNEKWDLIVCDEAHSMGAFAKPNIRAKIVRDVIRKYDPYVILMSGTPTPESYSQMYHQVYGIPNNPFKKFANFYRFCDEYVKIKERKINGLFIKDYSGGLDTILKEMEPYTINYTQEEAGFVSKTNEEVLTVKMKDSTYRTIAKLKKDLVVEGKEEVILADTPVKLMMKMHQLFSGTIKFESGKSMVLDLSKAEFIKRHFDGCKIGIFYKFKEELSALKNVFEDKLTTELDEFNDSDKNIALQIVSGREGISLRNAEYLVYYNIDFSATSYWQSKDRMTTKDRPTNDVYWVFSEGGIEHDIYKTVVKKKDFTINHFKKDFLKSNQ